MQAAALQAAALRLSGPQAALFCSDMHLDAGEPQFAAAFLSQLDAASRSISHLFLLGDLFEAWVGDDQADQAATATQQALAGIAARGVALFIMRGNRDFLIGEPLPAGTKAFDWRSIATLLDDPYRIDCFGEAVLLSHGDAWCSADLSYQQFRTQRNEPAWRREFLARPLAQRLDLARQMRAQSRLETANKDRYLMDVSVASVEAAMRQAQVRCVVHGHTHRPAQHRWQREAESLTRWVLPDWSSQAQRGGFLLRREGGWQQLGVW